VKTVPGRLLIGLEPPIDLELDAKKAVAKKPHELEEVSHP
jgi:hypothetical protein